MRTKRTLTKAESKVIDALYDRKDFGQLTHAYVTTTEELTLLVWNQHHPVEENTTKKVVPPGSTLKIVMVSRLGSIGLTDDLDADHGYHIRLDPADAAITDIRWERERARNEPYEGFDAATVSAGEGQ
jgi:hypothetical protein